MDILRTTVATKCGLRRTQRGVRWISKGGRRALLRRDRITDQLPAQMKFFARKNLRTKR